LGGNTVKNRPERFFTVFFICRARTLPPPVTEKSVFSGKDAGQSKQKTVAAFQRFFEQRHGSKTTL
jgi:hypothetical protein